MPNIPSLSTSQLPAPGQSRLKRPVSYQERPTTNVPTLKPPAAAASRGPSSPTRLPFFAQGSGVPKQSALPKRDRAYTSTGHNVSRQAQSGGRNARASPSEEETDSGPIVEDIKEEPILEEQLDGTAEDDVDHSEQSEPSPAVSDEKARVSSRGQNKTSAELEKKPGIATMKQTSARVTRAQSLRKPTASSASTVGPGSRTHSRHVSSASTLSSGRSSRVTSAETRPLRTTAGEGPRPATRSTRTPSTSTNQPLKRSASTKVKNDASASSTSTTSRDASRQPTQASTKRDLPDPQHNLARPAFSTLQQHYSPRKTPTAKPSTSTYIQPPPSEPSTHSTIETQRLQTTLLHLCLLHEASIRTTAQYTASAHHALTAHYDAVSQQHATLRAAERTMQEQLNLHALSEWTSGSTSFGLSENVHHLSSILKELTPLTEPGGRFPQLVESFETWVSYVEHVWAEREVESAGDGGESDEESELIDGLGADWVAENATLTRRLGVLARDAEMLLDAQEGSSVARLVTGCKTLLRGTLKELTTMTKIEKEVMEREKAWVQEKLDSIDLDAIL